MKRLAIAALLLSLTFAASPLLPQQSGVARVCVVGRDTRHSPPLAQQLNSTPQIRNQRDSVVKYVNRHKSPANTSFTLEAVALKSTSLGTVTSDADATGCTYLVTISSAEVPRADADPRTNRRDFNDLSGAGLPPPAPLNFSIMRREPAGWWTGLPEGSYNSSKWFAEAVANEVYAAVIKNP